MVVLNEENFRENVNEGVVLVDFFADWCGPCKMLGPVLEQLAEEYEGRCRFYKVNVDESYELAREFNVVSIPNLFVLKNGEVAGSLLGYNPPQKIKALIDNSL